MIDSLRTIPFLFYRLMFLSLLTMTGCACLLTAALAHYAGLELIATATATEFEALYTSIGIVGILCVVFVSTLLYLTQERRDEASDRRRIALAIEFAERRSGLPRRGA